jgi:hypothetical protein
VTVFEIDAQRKIGKLAFARRHPSSLLDSINRLPIAPSIAPDFVTLISATKRTSLTTGSIMSRVLDGSLVAYRLGDEATFIGIRFHVKDLNPIKTRQPSGRHKVKRVVNS